MIIRGLYGDSITNSCDPYIVLLHVGSKCLELQYHFGHPSIGDSSSSLQPHFFRQACVGFRARRGHLWFRTSETRHLAHVVRAVPMFMHHV